MKTRLIAGFLAMAFACTILPVGADSTEQLQNLKGSVSYQAPNQAAQPLAPKATLSLQDNDYAITGDASLGAVTLPDSSRVLIGQQTKIQLTSFSQTDLAHAKFYLYQGKMRFTVEHPKGAQADYTFSTPAAQISVRGTEGDISISPTNLQVNVYELTDPNLPVTVTLGDGRTFTLHAGESLVADLTASPVSANVTQTTDPLHQPFTEFDLAEGSKKPGWIWWTLLGGILYTIFYHHTPGSPPPTVQTSPTPPP